MMAAMDEETTVWIKQEEVDDMPNGPDSMVLKDPLDFGETSLHVKQEHELKHYVDGFEHNGCKVVGMCQETAMLIKKEEVVEASDQPDLIPPENSLNIREPSVHVKQEHEHKHYVDGSEHNALRDPLDIGEASIRVKQEHELRDHVDDFQHNFFEDPGRYIKQDPELNLDVDGSDHNVVASRSYASNSTRLLQSSGTCDFTFEETVRQGMSHSELEISSEESAHIAIFHEGEEEEKEEEEILSAPRLKCSLRENTCQIFSCSFCLRSFSSKYRLMIHVFVHIDGVQPPKFVCKSCGEVFPSFVNLQKHLKFSEADQDSSADKEETFDCSGGYGSILQDDREYSAMDQTGRQCSSNETVKSFTDKCNTQITTNNAVIRDRIVNNGTFDSTGKVYVHTAPLLEKTWHKCDVCEKSFTKLSLLKSHELIHTGTNSYTCEICGKSFTMSGHLKNHALIHTGIKLLKCDICGIPFAHPRGLKSHALIHTGMKPHTCHLCGKSFTLLNNLKTHALIHTGIIPHKCDICGKAFSGSNALKTHALIHSGTKSHKCDICGKSFTQLGVLKTHSLTHSGIKPHKCDICGKSFTILSNLKRHKLIHTRTLLHKFVIY